MPRVDSDLKLDFKDVLFRPKRSSLKSRSEMCPVCRSEVEHVQHVYLPTCTSLLNLTLTDNHQHRSSIPAPIHREMASPHSCSTTEYDHKIYHA